jgi:gamma-glutamyltranspeptidase/glutathione hydrolase
MVMAFFRSRKSLVLLVAVVVLAAVFGLRARQGTEPALSQREQLFSNFEYQPEPAMVSRDAGHSVAAIHPRVREVGMEVLRSGGNAYDAFVASVFAEYVIAEGGSSLAGPLGVLVYDAPSRRTEYLDADFNTPLDPKAIWTKDDMERPGKAVLVPGAPAGLEELAKRGKLGWARLLEPAIELATTGFKVSNLYAGILQEFEPTVGASDYGKRLFFKNGSLLKPGNLLSQPELAGFLRNLQKDGAAYMYTGPWAARFLDVVRSKGGRLTEEDLRSYRAKWMEPWRVNYRGYEVVASSGRSYGGPWSLLVLKALEHANLKSLGHPSVSATALEVMIRTARQAWATEWLFDCLTLASKNPPCTLADPDTVRARFDADGSKIWSKVTARMSSLPKSQAGSHSYHIIVVDREGNVVAGTHTIEGGAWGDGIFVEGVPLSHAGMVQWSTKPGQRRLSPLTMHFVFREGQLLFAEGSISNSIVETSVQLLVNLIDYGLPVDEAVTRPRFGTFPSTTERGLDVDWSRNWLSPDVSEDIVKKLADHDIKVWNKGIVDTGLGTVVRLRAGTQAFANASEIEATFTPFPYVVDAFGFGSAPPKLKQNPPKDR